MQNPILKTKLILMVLMGTLLLFSCVKDGVEGPVGPQGEQGPVGPQGPPGQDGQNRQDGEDGQDGNANVMASEWIPSEFSEDPLNISSFSVSDGRFTEEIIDSAAILAYGRQGSFVVNLPDAVNGETYNFSLGIGNIFFEGFSTTANPVVFDRFDSFRYVIIPSNGNAGKSGAIDFSKMSYEEVWDYFNLE